MQLNCGTLDLYLSLLHPNKIARFGYDIISDIFLILMEVKKLELEIQQHLLGVLDNFVMNRLQGRGMFIYGGYPRDRILNCIPNDIDIQFESKMFLEFFRKYLHVENFIFLKNEKELELEYPWDTTSIIIKYQNTYKNLLISFIIKLDIHLNEYIRGSVDFNVNSLMMRDGKISLRSDLNNIGNLTIFDVLNSIVKKEFYIMERELIFHPNENMKINEGLEKRKLRMINRGWKCVEHFQ